MRLQEVFRVSGMRAVMGQDIVGVVGACVSRILSFEVDWFELDLCEDCCWDGGVCLCLGDLLVEIWQQGVTVLVLQGFGGFGVDDVLVLLVLLVAVIKVGLRAEGSALVSHFNEIIISDL